MPNSESKSQATDNYGIRKDYPFSHQFENSVPFQEGPYVVSANSLDSDGRIVGGGMVACFKKLFPDANDCFQEIMNINTKYYPQIDRVDWENDEHAEIRTAEDTVHQARKNAKAALAREQEQYAKKAA